MSGDGWGDGLDLPQPEARALDILVNHFGGRMWLPDLFVSDTTSTEFRNLADLALVRRRFGGWEATLQGSERART